MFGRKGIRKRTERKALLGAAAGAAVIALVAGIAVVAHGYERSDQQLNDASVWVSNAREGKLGHANTAISELSTAVKMEGDGQTLAQDPKHVVVHSSAKNALVVLDPASAQAIGSAALPNGQPQVVESGSWVGVLDPAGGDLWVRQLADVAGFDSSLDPTASVGLDAVMAVDQQGRWAGFSQKASRLTTQDAGAQDVTFSTPTARAQVALVGGKAAVYNPDSRELFFDGKVQSLASGITSPDSVRLMQSTLDSSDLVLAQDGGLISVPRSNDSFALPVGEADGNAAAPVRSGRCVYGAWAGGRGAQLCDERDPEGFSLPEAEGSTAMVLRVNADTVVANDSPSGKSWAMQNGGALINNWADFRAEQDVVEKQREDRDVAPQPEKTQKPPVAAADTFGARPGRSNILPVLLNDADPNGDPLMISAITKGIPAEMGSLETVSDRQKLQLTLRPEAQGTLSFRYKIDDGRGGTAEAQVTVNIVDQSTNSAPVQARGTKTSVAQEGKATVQALQDWVDPESDPIYLVSARADAPNTATSTAQGAVDFASGGGEPGVDPVRIRVSDGTAATDGIVSVTVEAKGQTPIIVENYTVSGYVDNEIVTLPLGAARGGTGELTLSRVDDGKKDQLAVSASYNDGRVRITPSKAGTYVLAYSVKDAAGQSAAGTIRVDAKPLATTASAPVVAPTTSFLHLKNTADVDVLEQAYDPAGGVLSIAEVPSVPADSGVLVEVVENKRLRVTLQRDLPKPITLKVKVSNGTTTSEGDLTLVRVPEQAKQQPPVARDDVAQARVGEVVDIPVLANDTQPDDKPVTLERTLAQEPKAGMLVASNQRLRYLAPSTPGVYTARYTVASTDGQTASAKLTITVNAVDAALNRAPSAPTVTARAYAGRPITIPIPLTGVDPDGDSVTLSASVKQPDRGAVTTVGADSITYVPNAQTQGVDRFEYKLTDSLGAETTGTVRVGISPAEMASAPPVAKDDLVTTRPDTDLVVDVLGNDIDTSEKGLKVVSVEMQPKGVEATVVGGSIKVRTPAKAGSIAGFYKLTDETGATSSAWLYIDVRRDAPLAAPVTEDRVLSLSDVKNNPSMAVEVLNKTSFSEGSVSSLNVEVPEGYGDAKVDSQRRVVVPVRAQPSVIPFYVSRPDAPEVRATGFITVPGTEKTPPQLRQDAPKVVTKSGDEVSIPLEEQVIAAQGREVKITNAAQVRATQADGSALVKDEKTLKYRSEAGFVGFASLTVQVTDGKNEASVVIPIEVQAKQDQQPTLQAANLSVTAGESKTFNLRANTMYNGTDADALKWGIKTSNGQTVSARISGERGDQAVFTAAKDARVGSSTTFTMTVSNRDGATAQAEAVVTVVASQEPPPVAADDTVVIKRGDTLTHDVLNNDYSPFGKDSLSVVESTTRTSVDGVAVSTTDGGRTMTIKAADSADTGTLRVDYVIQDQSNDPSRRAVGELRVVVQDVPGAPGPGVQIADTNKSAGSVTLSAGSAEPNGSPITGYQARANVSGGEGAAQDCKSAQNCTVTGLKNGQKYSFQMRAVNAVGAGEWSSSSATVLFDDRPERPGNVRGKPSKDDRDGHSVIIEWNDVPQPEGGTSLDGYDVQLKGEGLAGDGLVRHAGADATSYTFTDGGVRPGSNYSISVRARTKTQVSEPGRGSVRAVGAPTVKDAESGLSGDGDKAQVSWSADGRGGPVRARVSAAGSVSGKSCSAEGFSPNADANSFEERLKDGNLRYVVDVSNGLFCTRVQTQVVNTEVGTPGGSVSTSTEGKGPVFTVQPKYTVTPGRPSAKHFFVLINDGAKPNADSNGWKRLGENRTGEFGEKDKEKTAWAMNCRTESKLFCSPVAKLGSETKSSKDLEVTRTGQDQCLADGEKWITLKAESGVRIEYRWRQSGATEDATSWTTARSGETIRVPEADEGEKMQLFVRSSFEDLRYSGEESFDKGQPMATCAAPQPPEPEPAPPAPEPPAPPQAWALRNLL
ncbi:Ig-like domain-containing protein [Galactobacter caseinivorans]|uniref:Fibronectin type III domain-containing protein n=1 Tax=Galactobacter caseinivorans TaxID=2676123 RepID=A0A496PKD8_9MICC|nr:Ig-like domain-containing protein [Galactobacter caseinivorans]RKW70974.1 fibronectin type III domain-containing protein [Galactobacter caseinivorans]